MSIKNITWITALRILAWYVHLSYFSNKNIKNFSYDPDDKIFAGNGLRNDVINDIFSIADHCVICGQKSTDDHIVAKNDEYAPGSDDPSNFMPLCKEHNSSKGKKDLLEWTIERYKRPFWVVLEREYPFTVKSGGWMRPDGKGIGRNVLRLYLHNRCISLKNKEMLYNNAPQFIINYIRLMELELKISGDLSNKIYFVSNKIMLDEFTHIPL